MSVAEEVYALVRVAALGRSARAFERAAKVCDEYGVPSSCLKDAAYTMSVLWRDKEKIREALGRISCPEGVPLPVQTAFAEAEKWRDCAMRWL